MNCRKRRIWLLVYCNQFYVTTCEESDAVSDSDSEITYENISSLRETRSLGYNSIILESVMYGNFIISYCPVDIFEFRDKLFEDR